MKDACFMSSTLHAATLVGTSSPLVSLYMHLCDKEAQKVSNTKIKSKWAVKDKRQRDRESPSYTGGERETDRESDLSDWVSQLNDTGPTWERGKVKLCARLMNPKTDNLIPPRSQLTQAWKKNVTEILSFCFQGTSGIFFCLCFTFTLLMPCSGRVCASILCQYLTLLPTTCSLAVTMDNMSGWLWQIKATRYMAITFTGWHGGNRGKREAGGSYGKGRGTGAERAMQTHTIDRWWNV